MLDRQYRVDKKHSLNLNKKKKNTDPDRKIFI